MVEPYVYHVAKQVQPADDLCLVVKMDVLDQYVGRLELVGFSPAAGRTADRVGVAPATRHSM
jgi:hypothetical protein